MGSSGFRRRLEDALRLYLVADPEQSARPLDDAVAAALEGGVTAVQLRAKALSDREAFEAAQRLHELCRRANRLFFVNDRIDIALAVDADGVHLGVDDLPLEVARRLLGPDKAIGYSPERDHQAELARARGADYLGVGPVFGTTTKSDAGTAIGLETLRRRIELAGVPVIGIGGITSENAQSVIQNGAAGVAVVKSILGAPDPRIAAGRLRACVEARPLS